MYYLNNLYETAKYEYVLYSGESQDIDLASSSYTDQPGKRVNHGVCTRVYHWSQHYYTEFTM
jgi:hypothetical protein